MKLGLGFLVAILIPVFSFAEASPEELVARAHKREAQIKAQKDREFDRDVARIEAEFQARGGRSPVSPKFAKAFRRNYGKNLGSMWFKYFKGKNGKWGVGGDVKRILKTSSGIYCLGKDLLGIHWRCYLADGTPAGGVYMTEHLHIAK